MFIVNGKFHCATTLLLYYCIVLIFTYFIVLFGPGYKKTKVVIFF